jgi:glycosyltransferase involved in cell wall biosynthesis
MSTQPRLLLISHDVIGQRMAGPGIRAWETGQILARFQPTTLIAPHPIDLASSTITLGHYRWGDPASLRRWVDQADLVLANGFVLRAHPELAQIPQPLALDLYDPVLLEDLETARQLSPEQRSIRHAMQQDLFQRQLAAGDFFICATERQRDLYLGALLASNRLHPEQTDHDPSLRQWIDVAPFGLPSTPPQRTGPGLRGQLPQIGADDPILLWTGGMWDWLDPLTLIAALPMVLEQHPQARLVFLAGRHPGMVDPMQIPARARQQASDLGLLDRHILFYDTWVPYAERANLLLDATIAVSLHHPTLETTYAAIRSRFLDHLWAGLPSVVSAGDAAADLVERHHLGRVAQPQHPQSVAIAINALLADPHEQATCAAQARRLAQHYHWDVATHAIQHFCQNPRRTRQQHHQTRLVHSEQPMSQHSHTTAEQSAALDRLRQLVAALHQQWQITPSEQNATMPLIGQAKQAINTLIRWYTQPMIEQQNQFNASTVNAIQAIATQLEQLTNQQAPLHQHIADIEQHLLDIDQAQTALARQQAKE